MQFIEHTNSIEIVFDKDDTTAEKSIVKHGIALIRMLLFRFREVGNKNEEKG